MIMGEKELSRLPEHLQRLFVKLPNHGSDEVLAVFPQTGPSSDRPRRNNDYKSVAKGAEKAHVTFGHADAGGSAARFFYCAKASKADRGEGNTHPTVKPTDLMRYLCKLVTPPGGTVLDPFLGSGSTGRGAKLEGFGFIGIELNPEYVEIARRRIAADAPKSAEAPMRASKPQESAGPLFGEVQA